MLTTQQGSYRKGGKTQELVMKKVGFWCTACDGRKPQQLIGKANFWRLSPVTAEVSTSFSLSCCEYSSIFINGTIESETYGEYQTLIKEIICKITALVRYYKTQ